MTHKDLLRGSGSGEGVSRFVRQTLGESRRGRTGVVMCNTTHYTGLQGRDSPVSGVCYRVGFACRDTVRLLAGLASLCTKLTCDCSDCRVGQGCKVLCAWINHRVSP